MVHFSNHAATCNLAEVKGHSLISWCIISESPNNGYEAESMSTTC